MNVWKVKGRHELTGSKSGQMYKIEDSGNVYYYLINILDSEDIYFISKPRNIKVTSTLSLEEVPKNLLEFHSKSTQMPSATTDEIKENIRLDKERLHLEKINNHLVYNRAATEFLLEQLSDKFKKVESQYIGSWIAVYIIDDTYKFIIKIDRVTRKQSHELISLKEENERIKKLSKMSGTPNYICRLFINNNFSDEDTLKVLNQLKADKTNNSETPAHSSYNYMIILEAKTGVYKLQQLTWKNKEKLYNFVFSNK